MKENLCELNQQAIADGLMLPDGQSLRDDYSLKLGKSLSQKQLQCYQLIY